MRGMLSWLVSYYDKFKKRFEQEAVLRNLSARTRKSYWWHIADYSSFCKKYPEQTGVEELRAYFQSMLTDGNHEPGSVKMGYFALRFLFVNIYHKERAKHAKGCQNTPAGFVERRSDRCVRGY